MQKYRKCRSLRAELLMGNDCQNIPSQMQICKVVRCFFSGDPVEFRITNSMHVWALQWSYLRQNVTFKANQKIKVSEQKYGITTAPSQILAQQNVALFSYLMNVVPFDASDMSS